MSQSGLHAVWAMVIEGLPAARWVERSDPRPAGGASEARPSRLINAGVFIVAAAFLLAYALPGGAFDVVTRQQYAIVIWWMLGVGVAVGLLPRARPGRLALLLLGALAAYAAFTALSLAWSDSSERTTAEVARVLGYLGVVGLIVSVLDRSTWRAAAMGLGFAALVVCGLGVASRLAPSVFPSNAFNGLSVANRLSYPFGYWNAVGAWASMSIAIGLAWSAHERSRVRRAVALGLVPLAGLAAYLSYSRASVAGIAVGVIAAVALSRNRLTAALHAVGAAAGAGIAILAVRAAPAIANGTGTRGVAGVLGAIAVGVAVAVAVALGTFLAGIDRARTSRVVGRRLAVTGIALVVIAGAVFGPLLAPKAWHEFRNPVVQSNADPASRLTQLGGSRYFYWQAAVDAFRAKPITGSGAGTFEFWWDQHGSTGDFIRNAHSLELENMAELGIPGLVLILAVMASAVRVLARARRSARRTATAGAATATLAAFLVYLVQASVDWMWQSTAVTVLALGGAGVAATRLSRGRPRIRWYGRGAFVLICACAGLVQLPGLRATVEIRRSQSAERAGNANLAYSWASDAVSAEPWAASAYEQRGLVLEAAGRLSAAAADFERAIAREPRNFAHWLLLARVETESGQIAAATRDYQRARQLRPRAGVFSYAPYFSGA